MQPFQPSRERIVVSGPIIDGLLTVLHIRFCQPLRTQLKGIFIRCFFALDFDKSSVACHQCLASKSMSTYLRPLSSTQAPIVVTSSFSAIAIISSFFARLCLHTLHHHLLTVNDTTSYSMFSSQYELNYDYYATIRLQSASTLHQDSLHW